MAQISKVKLQVQGMHCVSCALNIDFDLEDQKGVKSAKTSFAAQICEVEFEEDITTLPEIIQTIRKTGYLASPKDG